MQPIHDRMPVILSPDAWEVWLDPDLKQEEILLPLLKPFDAEQMQAWAVSSAVGKVADLDYFKQVNDTYGHPAGDAVLQEAARRMKLALRPYDRLGRYGGEEFLITAPGCTRDDAVSLAERIRSAISAEPVHSLSGLIPVTVSLGVAIGGDRMGEDAAMLIAAADEALYRAKKRRP